jgi:putative ABC transport system permease protein
MSPLRDARRRPMRAVLTASGIAIGVAALVLLGALSEKLGRLIRGGRDFAVGQITVTCAGSGALSGMTRGGLLSREQLAQIAAVPGVTFVAPMVMFPVSDAPDALPFTLSPLVFGVDVAALERNRHGPPPRVRNGKLVPEPGTDEVVVGSQVARHFDVDVGGHIAVRGRDFHVVGVLEPTFTGPDSFVFMPFPAAQSLLIETEPFLRRLAMVPGSTVLPIATAAAVFWRDGEDVEAVAKRIKEHVEGLSVVSPADAAKELDRVVVFLNSVMIGSGLVALVIASLAVANTMFTAVVERRREIGLWRVVGATRRQVIGRLLAEAAALGVAGSLLGLAVGTAAVAGLNAAAEHLGAPVFLMTPRLAVAAGVFPALLAAAAGLWPAWRAARLAPTEAIRWA